MRRPQNVTSDREKSALNPLKKYFNVVRTLKADGKTLVGGYDPLDAGVTGRDWAILASFRDVL